MKTERVEFLTAIITAAILFAAVDFAAGIIADGLAKRLPNFSEQLAKDNYRLHRLDTDIVIIGSSRGSHHYVTSQLSDSIDSYLGQHHSLYNAAIDGKFAKSNSCCAETIINRYTPRLVIFDISESQLCDDRYADIEFSLPYYWSDTIVRRYIDDISLKERILTKSSFYRYNGLIMRIVSSYMLSIDKDDGYIPLYGSTIDTTSPPNKDTIFKPFDAYTLRHFEDVLREYAKSDVPLIVVCSPRFRPSDNNDRLSSLCAKYNTPFLDFYSIPLFNQHPEWFRDGGHMNDEGAHVYTALFFEKLKPYL